MGTQKGNKDSDNVQSIKQISKDVLKTPSIINASILLSLDLKDTWSQIICKSPAWRN